MNYTIPSNSGMPSIKIEGPEEADIKKRAGGWPAPLKHADIITIY